MHIFHIATAADWAAARRAGQYTTSTRGRGLAEEGFLHASRREQVSTVFQSYYRDVTEPLVLLTIETDRLDVPWREDPVGDATYPHIYGPLKPAAVVSVQPLNRRGGTESFTSIFFREIFVRMMLALGAMLLAVLGVQLGRMSSWDWAPFLGGVAGLGIGAALLAVVVRRRG